MKKRKRVFLKVMALIYAISLNAAEPVSLVHNSIEGIEACKGKLKLELVRIWGGDEEEDEKKFFKSPVSVVVDKNAGLVYICDQHSHCVKAFNDAGEYVRTIGQRGRGPGDMFSPFRIALSSQNDLVVYEYGGFRIQWFSLEGKSKQILNQKEIVMWFGITSKDELALYSHQKTLRTKRLIHIVDSKGKVVKDIGTYHDKSNSLIDSEKLFFAIDESDNFYAVNLFTPVIRKYSPDGKLLMASTFETPYEIRPAEITINADGSEIKIVRPEEKTGQTRIERKGDSVSIQRTGKKEKRKNGVCWAFETDSRQRIYVVTLKRLFTEEEKLAGGFVWGSNIIKRDIKDLDSVKNIDAFRLLVFDPDGKIVAEAQMTSLCNGIRISGDRIFVIDGFINQRILEYKMHFDQ